MGRDSIRSLLLPFVTGLFCGSAVWLMILFFMRPDPQIDLLRRARRRIEALELRNQYLKDKMAWMASTQPKIVSIRLPDSQPTTATVPATQPTTPSAGGQIPRPGTRRTAEPLRAIGKELDRHTRNSTSFPALTTLPFVDPSSQPATTRPARRSKP